jgi:GNAT superfamily N-acetyltransferase
VTAEARLATPEDRPLLESLYRDLAAEMAGYSDLWDMVDGLEEPVATSWDRVLADENHLTVLGYYLGHPFGFLMARIEPVLAQGKGMLIGSIRLVFVEQEARAVGIGEAMRNLALETLRARGITRFDAHVLPGHRFAKNFFEQGGFSARHIVMHHDDDDD